MVQAASEMRRAIEEEVTSSEFLFERTNRYLIKEIAAPWALLLVCIVIVSLVSDWTATEILAVPVGFGLVIAVCYTIGRRTVACYRLGICYESVFRRRCHRYEELASLTYGPPREPQVEAWWFKAPVLAMFEIEPIGGRPRDRITFADELAGEAVSVRSARNLMAAAMARTHVDRIIAGQRLSWTGLLCFECDRVIFDFSTDNEQSVGIDELGRLEFAGNTLLVYLAGCDEPFAGLDMRARNFYPGLFCLKRLREHYKAPPLFVVDLECNLMAIR